METENSALALESFRQLFRPSGDAENTVECMRGGSGGTAGPRVQV